MRKLLVALVLALAPSLFAQTATVTGQVNTGSATAATGANIFVRMELKGCGGNAPRVNGIALLLPLTSAGNVYKDFVPNSTTGAISGTLYRNDNITCGTGTSSNVWEMYTMSNGIKGKSCMVRIATTTFDMTQPNCLNISPVAVAPTTDTTYLRIDQTNGPVTGKIIANVGMAVVNNVPLQWYDSTAVQRDIFKLTSGNVFQINGHPTQKQITIVPDGTTSIATWDGGAATNALTITKSTTAAALQIINSAGGLGLKVRNNNDAAAMVTFDNAANTINRFLFYGNGNATLCAGGGTCSMDRLQVNTGITQGSGLKAMRGGMTNGAFTNATVSGTTCPTAATVGATCSITISPTSPFADANYTVTCSVNSASGGEVRLLQAGAARTASSFLLRVEAVSAVASSAAWDCIAIHD